METITREEYIQKRREIDIRMRETRISEQQAIKKINIHYDDVVRDNEQEFRRRRDAILEERDQKREEVHNMYKDERRKIWEEDSLLVSQWRSQLCDPSFTPPQFRWAA